MTDGRGIDFTVKGTWNIRRGDVDITVQLVQYHDRVGSVAYQWTRNGRYINIPHALGSELRWLAEDMAAQGIDQSFHTFQTTS